MKDSYYYFELPLLNQLIGEFPVLTTTGLEYITY